MIRHNRINFSFESKISILDLINRYYRIHWVQRNEIFNRIRILDQVFYSFFPAGKTTFLGYMKYAGIKVSM